MIEIHYFYVAYCCMLLYLYIVKQTKTYTHYEITKHHSGNYFSSLFINLGFCSRYWEYERLTLNTK